MSEPVRPPFPAIVRRRHDLEKELIGRLGLGIPPAVLSVTDLVDLRRAFFRRERPVTMGAEQRQRVTAGREAHARILTLLGDDEFREVRIRGEGIVGEVDFLRGEPTELKTTGGVLPSVDGLRSTRPAYFEQLGIYCAMIGSPSGRLLLVGGSGAERRAVVLRCAFRSLEAIRADIRERAGRLRSSLERHDPGGLPRCAWRDRGCEYQTAGACSCNGAEPPLESRILPEAEPPVVDQGSSDQLQAALASPAPPSANVARFRDLLYPRRAYFEQVEPKEGPTEPERAEEPGGGISLYRSIKALLDDGPTGEVSRRWASGGAPAEPVACFRDAPYLLKTSKAWDAATEAGLARDQPQYVAELALRAGAVDRRSGLVVVGYERAPSLPEGLRVFEVEFGPEALLEESLRGAVEGLRSGIERRAPEELTACPGWMFERCAYRDRCGCAAAADGRR